MMIKRLSFAILSFTMIFSLCFLGCSSAPKRSMQESGIYNSTTSLLESANSAILTGDYDKATLLLNQAHNSAMSIDNYELLTSVALTKISLYLSKTPQDFEAAHKALENACQYCNFSEYKEKQTALCVLGEVRIAISDPQTDAGALNGLLSKLENNTKAVKGDPYNEGNFLVATADIYKIKKDYSNAEKLYVEAAKSFTDNRYLSEIGITWYKAAQVRSLNNNKKGALEAIDNAINYDRLAENTMALGADYYAKGVILLKGSPSSSEKDEAAYALEHSAQIYEAAGANEAAKKSREALGN